MPGSGENKAGLPADFVRKPLTPEDLAPKVPEVFDGRAANGILRLSLRLPYGPPAIVQGGEPHEEGEPD